MLNRLKFVAPMIALLAFASVLHADDLYTSAAAFNAATTGSESITFNAGCPSGPDTCFNYSTPGYTDAATGTTFSVASGGVDVTGMDYYGTGTYPEDFLIGASDASAVANLLTVTPPGGFSAIAFDMGSFFDATPFQVTLSDGTTYTITPPGASALSFFGFTSSNPITSISFGTPAGETFVIGDAEIAHAPEPSVLALLAAALVAFAVILRRERLALS